MLLRGMDTEERQLALCEISKSFQLMSYKYIGRKSIERRKKRRPNVKSGAIVMSSLSDDEKAKLTQELLHEYPERYGASQAAKYFERLFGGEKSITISEQSIQSRDDAMMAAASIMYSGSEEFPFEVEFLEGMIETTVAAISNIRIKRNN